MAAVGSVVEDSGMDSAEEVDSVEAAEAGKQGVAASRNPPFEPPRSVKAMRACFATPFDWPVDESPANEPHTCVP